MLLEMGRGRPSVGGDIGNVCVTCSLALLDHNARSSCSISQRQLCM